MTQVQQHKIATLLSWGRWISKSCGVKPLSLRSKSMSMRQHLGSSLKTIEEAMSYSLLSWRLSASRFLAFLKARTKTSELYTWTRALFSSSSSSPSLSAILEALWRCRPHKEFDIAGKISESLETITKRCSHVDIFNTFKSDDNWCNIHNKSCHFSTDSKNTYYWNNKLNK